MPHGDTVDTVLLIISSNLDWHMQRHGMSEDRLATASGISPRTVGNFLRPSNRKANQRGNPSGTLANLCKLAAALHVEPWELLAPPDSSRLRFLQAVEQAFQNRAHAEHVRTR